MKKRFLSILLTMCMVFSLLPAKTFAGGEPETDTETETETHINLDQAQIYVGLDRVSNYRLSGPGWRFEKETDTLVLNDFDIGGSNYTYPLGDVNKTIHQRAFIYVGGKDVKLKIRSEGNKDNWLGAYGYMGQPSEKLYTAVGDVYAQYVYYGIYNPSGTVEITGPAPLNIYTHSIGIYAKAIDIHGAKVTVNSYACPIYAENMNESVFNITGNSVVNVHAYSSQEAFTPMSNITAYFAVHICNLNVSDGSQLNAEVERISTPVIEDTVKAIDTRYVDINAGKVRAICRDNVMKFNRPSRSNGAIKYYKMEITGGELEGYVYNSNTDLTKSCVFMGNSQIHFKDSAVVRGGIKLAGEEDGLGLSEIKTNAKYMRLITSDTNNRPEGFGIYQEFVAAASDGIFLWDGGNELKWSYYSDFETGGSILKPAQDNDIDRIISGAELRPVLADYPDAPITIQSGKFYLNTSADDGKALVPGTIEIKKGAELIVLGGGKIDGLDVIGEGKITFLGSTVAGKVDKTVTMVVDGGNINIDYDGIAQTSDGTPVSRCEYVLASDTTTFEQATYVVLMDGRDYGSAGLYPFNGKKLYLWLKNNANIRHVSAIQSDDKYGYTLYPTSTNACLLEKTEVVEVNSRTYYVAVPGQNSQIIPFQTGTDHAKRYNLTWSFSDDGYTWYGIYDQDAVGDNGELNLTDVYDAWCNRMYRCEIRSKEDGKNTLLGVYTGLLYIFDPVFTCEGGFVDGKEVTVRFAPKKQPGISSCGIFGIFWEVSEDGKNFKQLRNLGGKDSYTFIVSDEMDGWVFRCSAFAGNILNYVMVEKNYTINVIEKKPHIEEQPENNQWIDLTVSDEISLSVKARNATQYQWQVSKRPYVDSKGYDFENIPGATGSTYSFPMNSLTWETRNNVYRCVVSNEYGNVISDEVYFNKKQTPHIEGMDTKMTVSPGEEAYIYVNINAGNPSVANTVSWEVSTDGGVTYRAPSDVMTYYKDYTLWEIVMRTAEGVEYTANSNIAITSVTAAMDGWLFRFSLYVNGTVMQETVRLNVHQHEWSDKLTYDGENHWYACAACDAKKDEAAHSYGEGCTPYCTVCGRERAVTHDFRLMTSETEHWYQCANCPLESGRQAHSYDNDCDGDCNFCKRTRTVSHNYEWQHDEEHHWQLCSKCHDKQNEAAHSFTVENTDSRYLKAAVSCTQKAVFYKSCADCGLSSQGTAHEATFTHDDALGHDIGAWISNGNGTHTRICARDASHTETEDCVGGTATCKDKAKCAVCGESYGELDTDNHADIKHIEAKAATETSGGNIEYWYCEGCGKYFSDKESTKEITKADTVTAKLPVEKPAPPATGAGSNLYVWILIIAASMVMAGCTAYRKYKKL